jgi:hypothetical protein
MQCRSDKNAMGVYEIIHVMFNMLIFKIQGRKVGFCWKNELQQFYQNDEPTNSKKLFFIHDTKTRVASK